VIEPVPGNQYPDLLWRRVGAGIIDAGIVVVVAVVAALVFGAIDFLPSIIALLYSLGALVWWQGRTGASPGKSLVGLRVVDATGQPCGTGKAATRWVLWIVDGFPYCVPLVAFFMVFTNADQRRVGDRVAGTWVIDRHQVGRRPLAGAAAGELLAGPDPAWDDLRQAYVRTDPSTGRREVFDETTTAWSPIDE
jgi:uncharacterized RDD family membrane protein YckC